MINESQCYPKILSVHHIYIIVSIVGPKVILKVVEVSMMGLGVGIVSHIKTYLQTRDRRGARDSMFMLCVFILTLSVIIIIRR